MRNDELLRKLENEMKVTRELYGRAANAYDKALGETEIRTGDVISQGRGFFVVRSIQGTALRPIVMASKILTDKSISSHELKIKRSIRRQWHRSESM